jgi:hypothetical protein
MISDNQMDEFFNDRLRYYPSSVPTDMWDRIVEKKKRDRMIWLFFFSLLAFGVLLLGLAGGYYIFNLKKSASTVKVDYSNIDHKPFFKDSIKASVSNSLSIQNQTTFPQIDGARKKTNQKVKEGSNYLEYLGQRKNNTPKTVASSQFEYTSKDHSKPNDFIASNENKADHKNDSLNKKLFAKTPSPDSSQRNDLKKPKPEEKLPSKKWFLDLYVSPDYPIVSPQEYEQSKLSYTIGIKLNRSLGTHFSIKTGIQYSQVNIISNDSSFGGAAIHLMRLDLPFLVGYSLGKRNLKTTINGGAIINLYSWLRGNQMPDLFKTNTGLSLYLGVNFESRINDRFSLFGEPYYRYQLTSMTVSSVSTMKFIDVVGISIGARYYFKK